MIVYPSPLRCVRQSEGDLHTVLGDPIRFIMTGPQTGGGYSIFEIVVHPGNVTPSHIHHHEEEAFYILQGDLTVGVGTKTQVLSKGDFIHIPRGIVRNYHNASEQIVRILVLHSPGTTTGFYMGLAGLEYPPDFKDVVALGQSYGIEVVEP